MNYKNESWEKIKELNNMYEVSNYGRIRRTDNHRLRKQNFSNKNTYITMRFWINKKWITLRPHRLVAIYFIDNPNNYNIVNHIDMNKQNNYFKNLEWCTQKHNQNEAMKKKPQMINGIKKYNRYEKTKRIVQLDKEDNYLAIYPNAEIAGKITGICARNILQVVNKTPFNNKGAVRKTAGGYIWKFESEVVGNGI